MMAHGISTADLYNQMMQYMFCGSAKVVIPARFPPENQIFYTRLNGPGLWAVTTIRHD